MSTSNNIEKSKYLFKNTFILFVSNFSSKILVFFMLPLYTSVLSTSEYGISDLIHTTVNILYIFLTFYISSGVLRFTMDKETDKNEILSVGMSISLVSSIIVAVGCTVARIFDLFPELNDFYGYLLIIYAFYCVNLVLAAYAKGVDKLRLIGIAGVMATATKVSSNILMLVVLKWGIKGYLLSSVLSSAMASLIYIFGGSLKGARIVLSKKENFVKAIKYSAPVAATELGWMICTSSDKYIISFMLGTSATGIISVAHRLPTILSAFTSIFIQAWQISAIKEFDDKNNVRYYTQMFNYYNSFAVCAGAFLIIMSKVIGSFLYRGDFTIAWIYTPIYLLALVINTLSSFCGSIISASKQTKYLFTSTMAGAVLNIVLDVALIRFVGLFGAGIATAISYMLIGYMRINAIRKNYPIVIEKKRFILSYLLLISLTVSMIFTETMLGVGVSIILCGLVFLVNRRKILGIIKVCLNMAQTVLRKCKNS